MKNIFNKYSVTITGLVVILLTTVLTDMGFSEDCAGEITAKIPVLLGVLAAWIGRARLGDIHWYGVRKA